MNVADKLYKILQDKCRSEFEDASWREWHVALRDRGISSKGFDNHYDQIEELMSIINKKSGDFLVCPDPWVNENQTYEQEGFLIIPFELAEKMLVLGVLP